MPKLADIEDGENVVVAVKTKDIQAIATAFYDGPLNREQLKAVAYLVGSRLNTADVIRKAIDDTLIS